MTHITRRGDRMDESVTEITDDTLALLSYLRISIYLGRSVHQLVHGSIRKSVHHNMLTMGNLCINRFSGPDLKYCQQWIGNGLAKHWQSIGHGLAKHWQWVYNALPMGWQSIANGFYSALVMGTPRGCSARNSSK